MSVASGRAGRVLAQPLFRRLNAHVRALNTREVIRIRTSKPSRLRKLLPIIVRFALTGKKVTLRLDFQAFCFSRWAFLTATKPVLTVVVARK